jgi:hypothetical protein
MKIKEDSLKILDVREKKEKCVFAEEFKDLKKENPKLFEFVTTCSINRIQESREILEKMISQLILVQDGKKDMTTIRNDIFEVDLARKYMKPK